MVNNTLLKLSKELGQIYKLACLAEVEALKPGNVHIFADGHGMEVQDFVKSAEASSLTIAQPNLSLGERILLSIEATWHTVNCNTNLGIILLSAPIIHAVQLPNLNGLLEKINHVLNHTTKQDAELLFKAIRVANPAGLGRVEEHDVHASADCTLLEAMQSSASKDLIALQYANGFQQVLEEGLPYYQEMLQRWERPAWATTALYLYWLSHYSDSHIYRKFGDEAANQVKKEAVMHFNALHALENPKHYMPDLLAFDQSLKARKINPGTSADLTVAVLLLQNFAEIGLI